MFSQPWSDGQKKARLGQTNISYLLEVLSAIQKYHRQLSIFWLWCQMVCLYYMLSNRTGVKLSIFDTWFKIVLYIYILYIFLICDNCCFSEICSPTIKVDDWFPSSVEKTKENQSQKHLEASKDAFCLCFLLCPCRRLVGSHHRLLFDILVKFDQTGKTDVWASEDSCADSIIWLDKMATWLSVNNCNWSNVYPFVS